MRNWCVKVENGNISKANRKFWKDCLPFLFLTFCAYGILLSRHYAVDTYVCCRNEQVTIFFKMVDGLVRVFSQYSITSAYMEVRYSSFLPLSILAF